MIPKADIFSLVQYQDDISLHCCYFESYLHVVIKALLVGIGFVDAFYLKSEILTLLADILKYLRTPPLISII